jgi:hypothetical protein
MWALEFLSLPCASSAFVCWFVTLFTPGWPMNENSKRKKSYLNSHSVYRKLKPNDVYTSLTRRKCKLYITTTQ